MAAATCHSGHHNTPGPSMAAATCHSVHHSPSPPQCRPTMATSLACCIPYWSHCHSHHSEVPILLQSHTPHRLQIQVGALEKFVFAIHPCFRVKVVNPDSLFCLPSLRFGTESVPGREEGSTGKYQHQGREFPMAQPEGTPETVY